MRSLPLLLAGTILSALAFSSPALSQSAGAPVETAKPHGDGQTPAFKGQTRAAQPAQVPKIEQAVVAQDLPKLWSMEFLPDGRMLVTAKEGSMHIVSKDGKASDALKGVPEVASGGQGGLLDVVLAPDFTSSGLIFFSFSEPRDGGNGTSVARAKLVQTTDGGASLEDTKVIFRQTPTYDGNKHFGSRLVFGPKNELYVTVGERSDKEPRVQSQDVGSGLGKVFRINTDGKALSDNPLIGTDGALQEIWSYGHRNLQAAALDGQGRLWTVEHGPKGGDELNRPEAGKNYGWPKVTYGIEYSGTKVGDGITALEGTEQPVYYWDPVIGPSGMAFYEGDQIPEWKGAFLIGGLVTEGLVVMHLDSDKVTFEERVPLEARIRDVKIGPDGAVYAVTEDGSGSTIVKLTKA